MGKTVGAILTIGAAVAVNVIPGVGQALSGAIVGLGGGTFAALGVAQAVVGAVTLGVTVSGLQAVGGLLGLGPNAPKAQTASTAIKGPRPPRVSAYGEMRLYPNIILFETADGNSSGMAVDVYAIHDGEMTEPVQYYLNDDKVTVVGNVVQPLLDGRYGDLSPPKVHLYLTDGSSPGTAIPAIVSALPGIWTNNHRGDGVVIMAMTAASVKSKHFLDVYPNGAPQGSIAAKWQPCPDPWAADPLDEAGWTYTENVVRHMLHYMLVREAPRPTISEDDPAYPVQLAALRLAYWDMKIAPALTYWRTASDICDEPVPLKTGGTEPRYRGCLSHAHTTPHGEVRAALLALCDGWMATRPDGSYAIYAGKYQAPTVSIGPEHIVAYEWEGVGVDDDTAVNEIVCSYVSRDHDYNSVETDAWRDEGDISARGLLSETMEMQTPSWGQVRRLAKRKMARTNALYRGTVTTNIAGRIARGERYINLHLEEAETVFFSGVAEITAVTRNVATGGVTFSWVAADPNIDAWNPATEEGDPASVGDRVAPQPLDTPEITDAEAELGDDGSSARIRITVDGFDRDDITWYARWRVTTDTTWNEQEYSDIDPGPAAQLLTTLVPINVAVDVQVAYSVGDGRLSEWSALEAVSTSTAVLAPSPPSDLSGTGGTGAATITWTNSTSANLSYSQVYRNSSDTITGATHVGGDLSSAPGAVQSYVDSVGAGTYYYWVVAFSATGADAAPVAAGSVTVT